MTERDAAATAYLRKKWAERDTRLDRQAHFMLGIVVGAVVASVAYIFIALIVGVTA